MSAQKTEEPKHAPKDETLIERYRPLGLKAVAAAALHQKPKSKPAVAKTGETVKDWREH